MARFRDGAHAADSRDIDVFCAGNDAAIEFLQAVLSQVLDIFPSPFIHVGGDECPKTRWQRSPG